MKGGLALKNNLKSIRIANNFSQEELTSKVGTSRQTIIAIEKGNFNPSTKLAILLAIALYTTVEEIFYF